MIRCKYCKTKIDEKTKVCPKCRAAVVTEDKPTEAKADTKIKKEDK